MWGFWTEWLGWFFRVKVRVWQGRVFWVWSPLLLWFLNLISIFIIFFINLVHCWFDCKEKRRNENPGVSNWLGWSVCCNIPRGAWGFITVAIFVVAIVISFAWLFWTGFKVLVMVFSFLVKAVSFFRLCCGNSNIFCPLWWWYLVFLLKLFLFSYLFLRE